MKTIGLNIQKGDLWQNGSTDDLMQAVSRNYSNGMADVVYLKADETKLFEAVKLMTKMIGFVGTEEELQKVIWEFPVYRKY